MWKICWGRRHCNGQRRNRARSRIQLDAAQHRDEHSAERKERAADAVDRLNRQLTINLWMGALTALVVLNLLLVALVLYGR